MGWVVIISVRLGATFKSNYCATNFPPALQNTGCSAKTSSVTLLATDVWSLH